jgi:hypothetical protein
VLLFVFGERHAFVRLLTEAGLWRDSALHRSAI